MCFGSSRDLIVFCGQFACFSLCHCEIASIISWPVNICFGSARQFAPVFVARVSPLTVPDVPRCPYAILDAVCLFSLWKPQQKGRFLVAAWCWELVPELSLPPAIESRDSSQAQTAIYVFSFWLPVRTGTACHIHERMLFCRVAAPFPSLCAPPCDVTKPSDELVLRSIWEEASAKVVAPSLPVGATVSAWNK